MPTCREGVSPFRGSPRFVIDPACPRRDPPPRWPPPFPAVGTLPPGARPPRDSALSGSNPPLTYLRPVFPFTVLLRRSSFRLCLVASEFGCGIQGRSVWGFFGGFEVLMLYCWVRVKIMWRFLCMKVVILLNFSMRIFYWKKLRLFTFFEKMSTECSCFNADEYLYIFCNTWRLYFFFF